MVDRGGVFLLHPSLPLKMYVWVFVPLIELVTISSDFDRDCSISPNTRRKPKLTSNSASEIRQDYPLNLSILLSGGKEINEDCLSSGE